MKKPINIDEITSIPKPIATPILDQQPVLQSKVPVDSKATGQDISSVPNLQDISSVPNLQDISSVQTGQGEVAQAPESLPKIQTTTSNTKDVAVVPSLSESPNSKLDSFNPLSISDDIGMLYNKTSDALSNVKDNFVNPLFGISNNEGQQFAAQSGQTVNDVINNQANIPALTGDNLFQTKANTLDTMSEEEAKKNAANILNIKPEKVDELVNKGDISYFFSSIPNNLNDKSSEEKQKTEKQYETEITKELSKYVTGESSLDVYSKDHGLNEKPFTDMVGQFLSNDNSITTQYQKEIQGLSKEETAKKTKEYHTALLDNFKHTLEKSTENHGLFWLLPGVGESVKEKISMADYRSFRNSTEQSYHNYIMVRENEYKKQQGKAFIEKARKLEEDKTLGKSNRTSLENSKKSRNQQFNRFGISITNTLKNNSIYENGTIEQKTNMIKKGTIYNGMYKKTMREFRDPFIKTYDSYIKNQDNIKQEDKTRIELGLIKEFNRINSIGTKIKTAYTAGFKADIEGGDSAYAINNILKGENGIDTNLYGEKTVFNETAENTVAGNLGDISYDINKSSNNGKYFGMYSLENIFGNHLSRGFSYIAHKFTKTSNQLIQYGFDKAGFGYVGGGTNVAIAGLSESVVDPAVSEDNGFWYNTYIKGIYRTSDQGQEALGTLLGIESLKGVGALGEAIGKAPILVNTYNKIKTAEKINNFVSSVSKGNNTARLLFKSLGLVAKGTVQATKEIAVGEMFGGMIDQKMGTVSDDLDIHFNMAFGLIDLWQGFAPAFREFKLFKRIGVDNANKILASLGENYKATDSFIKGVNDLLAQGKKDADALWRKAPEEANRTAKWSFFKKMIFDGYIPVEAKTNVVDAIISIMKGDLHNIPQAVQPYVKGMVQNVANDSVTISKFIEDVLMPRYVDGEGKTVIGSEPNIKFGESVSVGSDVVSNKDLTSIERPKDVEKVGIKGDGSVYTEEEISKIKNKAEKMENKGEIQTDGLKKENIESSFSKQEDGTYKINNDKLGIKDNRTQSQKVFDDTIKNRTGKDFYKVMEDNGYIKEAKSFKEANTYETILKTMADTLC